jgi:T-complex protein 1 subunit beta
LPPSPRPANPTIQSSFSPTQIFEEGTTEEKGENARLNAFAGAIAVGDLVKSTLGPKGMDKILQSAWVVVPHPL